MNSPVNIRIMSCEVLDDIRSAAWLESEIHPECNLHQRHEMADICEKGNIERVWRVLGAGVAEIRMALREALEADDVTLWQNNLERPREWCFSFTARLLPQVANLLKEKIHEYLVARVIADRLRVLMPVAPAGWEERTNDAMALLSSMAHAEMGLTPVRRPLWPL